MYVFTLLYFLFDKLLTEIKSVIIKIFVLYICQRDVRLRRNVQLKK